MNPSPSNTIPNAVRIAPRLVAGTGILAVGILWMLDNLDLVHAARIVEWWPAILIVVGLVRLLDPHKNRFASVLFMVVGAVLLLDNLDVSDVDLRDLIPLGIAAIGAKLIWDAIRRPKQSPLLVTGDPDSTFSAFALWAGVKRQTTSDEFRGGDATAIMGGVEIDLRNAKVRDGEQAVIDAFALWGAVEITVPENWRVVSKVLPLMGAFEDKTRVTKDTTGPTLVIQGTALMGGIDVKN